MTVSRVNVGIIGVTSLVEVGFLVRLEFAFGTGRLDLQWLLELMFVVLLPLLLILLPNLIYQDRNIMLPLSGCTLVYLFSGVSMGFMALAIGPLGAEAAIFLGLVVQVLTAGANFLGALRIEA